MTTVQSVLNANNMDALGGEAAPQPQPQQQPQQQQPAQPVYIVVQPPTRTPSTEHYANNFPSRWIRAMSAAQLFLFFAVAITQIFMLIFEPRGSGAAMAGFWCGILFGLAGSLGLIAASKTTSCSVVSFMVMNILAAIFSVILLMFDFGGHSSLSSYRRYSDNVDETRTAIAQVAYGLQMFSALVEGLISLVCAVICCRASCCRKAKAAGTVVYAPNQAQAVPIPMQPIEGASVAVNMPAGIAGAQRKDEFPPKYEEAAASHKNSPLNEDVPEEGQSYQRFA